MKWTMKKHCRLWSFLVCLWTLFTTVVADDNNNNDEGTCRSPSVDETTTTTTTPTWCVENTSKDDGSVVANIRYTKPARTRNHNGINIDNPHTAFGTKDPNVFASQHGSVSRSLLPKDILEASVLENDLEYVKVTVYNARRGNFGLMKDGFQLATVTDQDLPNGTPSNKLVPDITKDSNPKVLDDYLRTIERVAIRITGAKAAFVYNNFTWRSLASDDMNFGDYAHTDVGRYSWCTTLTTTTTTPTTTTTTLDTTTNRSMWPPQLQQVPVPTNVTRFAAVTVWRLLQSDHEQSHLGFLDHRTLREGDMVNFTMLAANDTFGSNYRLKYQPETSHHRWYYYPQLDKDRELLFFLAHDATHEVLPIVHSQVHAAFNVEGSDREAPSRRSVDSRILLVF